MLACSDRPKPSARQSTSVHHTTRVHRARCSPRTIFSGPSDFSSPLWWVRLHRPSYAQPELRRKERPGADQQHTVFPYSDPPALSSLSLSAAFDNPCALSRTRCCHLGRLFLLVARGTLLPSRSGKLFDPHAPRATTAVAVSVGALSFPFTKPSSPLPFLSLFVCFCYTFLKPERLCCRISTGILRWLYRHERNTAGPDSQKHGPHTSCADTDRSSRDTHTHHIPSHRCPTGNSPRP